MHDDLYLKHKAAAAELLHLQGDIGNDALLRHIEEHVWEDREAARLCVREKRALILRVYYAFRGLDALQPLLDDPHITEIMVNRHDEIFVEKDGEIARISAVFESEEKLEDIIQ